MFEKTKDPEGISKNKMSNIVLQSASIGIFEDLKSKL